MESDARVTSESGLDLANPDAIYEHIKTRAVTEGHLDSFTVVLQQVNLITMDYILT